MMAHGPYCVVVNNGVTYVVPVSVNTDDMSVMKLTAAARIIIDRDGKCVKNSFGAATR